MNFHVQDMALTCFQIVDTPGSDEVTLTRSFGNEESVFSFLPFSSF